MSYTIAGMDVSNMPIFTTASETLVTATMERIPENLSALNGMFSPLAPSFRARESSELMGLMNQEPSPGDIAPAALHMDNELLMNFRNNTSEAVFGDIDHNHNNAYFLGGPRAESVTSNLWGEESTSASSGSQARNDEMSDTFDFLAKSLSSANSYVSMLTREQLSVLRAFRPSLLYEFLQEVAKVRNDKRLRRAGPNECAFCKNNGENEECYSSHALKDWRGRVLCPVLRAFRCPRCGSTGDRAHTIKYCPEHGDNVTGLERSGSFARRRMGSSSTSLLFGPQLQPQPQPQVQSQPQPSTAPTPAPGSLGHSSIWNFNMN